MASRRGGERIRLIDLKDKRDQPDDNDRSSKGHGHSRAQPTFHKPHFKRWLPEDFIERIVLPTDTLQGIALLYNTSISELKRVNNLHTESDLHARRVIKVPSRGVLINLEPEPEPSSSRQKPGSSSSGSSKHPSNSNHGEGGSGDRSREESESELQLTNGEVYLNKKDTVLNEIIEKANNVAANSIVLNQPPDTHISKGVLDVKVKRNDELSIKWWHILCPCLIFILIFPILLYIVQEHILEINQENRTHNPNHHH